jgi:hypothetical protein
MDVKPYKYKQTQYWQLTLTVLLSMDSVNVNLSSICAAAQSGPCSASSTWQFILAALNFTHSCLLLQLFLSLLDAEHKHVNAAEFSDKLWARSTLIHSVRAACWEQDVILWFLLFWAMVALNTTILNLKVLKMNFLHLATTTLNTV